MLEQAGQQQQAMLSQVLQHVMALQSHGPANDVDMDGWDQVPQPTDDELPTPKDPRMEQLGCLEHPGLER